MNNEKNHIFHKFKSNDFTKDIFHLDGDNILYLKNVDALKDDIIDYSVQYFNRKKGLIFESKLSIADSTKKMEHWKNIQLSQLSGFKLAFFNDITNWLKIIDVRTGNILWKSDIGEHIYTLRFFDDCLYYRTESYLSCLDTSNNKFRYRIQKSYATDEQIVSFDDQEFFIYKTPINSYESDCEVLIQNLKFDYFEEYSFNIRRINPEDHITPTKYGVLHIPRFIRSKRISLYKPGVDEPYYETDPIFFERAFDVNSVSYVRDGEFLELRCSKNYNNLISDEDTVNIYLEIETGKIFDKERYAKEVDYETP